MAELWYYTCEGKEKEPVSLAELKRLAAAGSLRPTDMVWTDGMPRWVRASVATEFFPDVAAPLDAQAPIPVVIPIVLPGEVQAPPARKSEKDRRRRREEAEERDLSRRHTVGSRGAFLALGVGAGIVVCALLVGAVAVLIKPQPIVPVADFPDVDLAIEDQAGNKLAEDPSYGPDCFIGSWSPPTTGEFNVVVQDLDVPGFPARSTVTIHEVDSRAAVVPPYTVVLQVNEKNIRKIRFQKDKRYEFTVRSVVGPPAPPQVNALPAEPPPAGVLGVPGNVDFAGLRPGAEHVFKFQLHAGLRARIHVVGHRVKAGTNLDLFVQRDRDNVPVAQDVKQHSDERTIVLDAAPATEIYRVRIVNTGTVIADGSVFFTKQ